MTASHQALDAKYKTVFGLSRKLKTERDELKMKVEMQASSAADADTSVAKLKAATAANAKLEEEVVGLKADLLAV